MVTILRQYKGLSFGIVFLLLVCVCALLAYWIAPDNSTYANRMVVEISGQKPGYRQLFLKQKKQEVVEQNIWHILWNGKTDIYEWIPIVSYTIQGDTIVAEKFVDEDITEKRKFFTGKESPVQYIEEKTFWLGTDKFGRDILSRLLVGARISLSVGVIAVILSITIGIFLGAIAGYWGGIIDRSIMWFLQVIWSLPTLLLVFGVMFLLGKGLIQVMLAIGLSLWVNVARMVRGQVMAVKELAYIEAAKTLGYSHTRIIFRHILPNIMGSIWVMAASNFATAIMLEAGLSFLGLGIPAPQPSWGLMMKEQYNFIITQNPALALAPGIAIAVTVFSFHLIGNGLRDILDVKSV
jgi:ABC-type dipeptide/oligopeptide/nickel transport system permease subunit